MSVITSKWGRGGGVTNAVSSKIKLRRPSNSDLRASLFPVALAWRGTDNFPLCLQNFKPMPHKETPSNCCRLLSVTAAFFFLLLMHQLWTLMTQWHLTFTMNRSLWNSQHMGKKRGMWYVIAVKYRIQIRQITAFLSIKQPAIKPKEPVGGWHTPDRHTHRVQAAAILPWPIESFDCVSLDSLYGIMCGK